MTKSLRHDLRTPINQILGYSEMLQEEAVGEEQDRFVPDLQKINAAARNLLALIDKIPDALLEDGVVKAASAPAAVPHAPAPASAAVIAPPPSAAPPPVAPGALVAPAAQAPGAAKADKATLLVVDDNEMNRDMLSRRLKGKGYTVLTADDGQQALDVLSQKECDLVLLDIMMPVLSGIDVLKIVRQTRSASELPIIMATAKDQGEDIVEALKLGANDYVTKPLDFPVVLARTETQLSLKSATEEVRRLAADLEVRNRFIRKTFGRYLSDEIVSSLLETEEGLKLGGEKRTVTLLMSDLRGFTAAAEKLDPEQVVRILNHYLGTMADIITSYQGTIDEFIGDAVFALFGAPYLRPDDAERAAACAVAMQIAMGPVNEFLRQEGLPEIQMGIGLNTGEVVVGNIGSHTRAKYGVVGSHVNLTARIESFTVGGQILISDATLKAAGESLQVGQRLEFSAKGFKEPIAMYDLRGVAGRHGLALKQTDEVLEPLHPELPVHYVVLDGKHIDGQPLEGHLTHACPTGGEIRADAQVPALSNVRIRLLDDRGQERPADLYAKVMAPGDNGASSFRVRFTSTPPEIAKLLAQAVAQGASAG